MVDYGIVCYVGVIVVKVCGWQVLVIDYYLFGLQLLLVDVIVDFNFDGDVFFSKLLVGVGVIFYVLMVLCWQMCEVGVFVDGKGLDFIMLLDLVVVGIVVDLVVLDLNNCVLVSVGLCCLCVGQGCVGLCVLIEVSGCDVVCFIVIDIGFVFGLCLNVVGWLEDMVLGIVLLLIEDLCQVCEIVQMLEQINLEWCVVQQLMIDDVEQVLIWVVLDMVGQ